jgi:hypothetical protein
MAETGASSASRWSRPNDFTRLTVQHPVGCAIGFGLICGGLAVLAFESASSFVLGVPLGLLHWFLWRPGGWFRRYEERRASDAELLGPVDYRKIALTVACSVGCAVVTFVGLYVTRR